MARIDRQQSVLDLLKNFRGLEPLKQLFWSELNYQRINQPLSRRGWSDTTANFLSDDPLLFASGGQSNDFHVVYARMGSDRLHLGHERPVVSRLTKDHPYALFILSNNNQDFWHFINVKFDKETEKRRQFRRITVGPDERLRTASERLALLDLSSISPDLFGLPPLTIQERHDEAFDVEAVTKVFFEEYKAVFHILQDDLTRQSKSSSWAHDYALQFLNRCMFLYFIQRKGWLGKDKEFLGSFWEGYKKSTQPANTFVDKWLKIMFFEAFNRKFHGGHLHLPEKIREALSLAPFLNGGLFTENELDRRPDITISDVRFEQIFKFFERYNFTIAEDSPLDKEVAVDPEMIGKVYESLVNVEETSADQRSAAGIFYTPRTEIDLMCRLALVDHLTNHLGFEHKSLLYQLVFALEPDEKLEADEAFSKVKLWPSLNDCLRGITVADPACGSGSFLVGMLHIFDDLQERAGKQLGIQENSYERKKRIVGQSLYGIDVMDWACHVAELRLWLVLIIDAEFSLEELNVRREPLLPHFSFKIRCGDSLVQEVGGINLGHMHGLQDLPQGIKSRITKLKTEKLKFYNNDPTCQYKSLNQVKEEELRLFREIIDTRHLRVQEEIKALQRKIDGPISKQIRLDGKIEGEPQQIRLEAMQWKKQIESLKVELERIDRSRSALKSIRDVPFVWDIAFVEIFEGERGGFDIVIGNPPYVRQENIADPRLSREEVTTENKKEYKAKLARSVYQAFPRFFGYNTETDTAAHKLDAKSDLYIYFYFHGLSLLHPNGSFSFITSNSWLDVGYGKDLQEFLLKHSYVKMILDNQARRSFAQADVNTVIVLLSSPDDRRDWAVDKIAKFSMFKVPFEHILSPIIFDEIEVTADRKVTPEYRVSPVSQKNLLEEGWEWPEDATEDTKKRFGFSMKGSKYGGNKWGGKYLRAPDIYWTILEKGKGKLVRLGDIAEVRFGIKTGANDFFYLDKTKIAQWQIEPRFLQPVIVSPRECRSIMVEPDALKFKVFVCNVPKSKLLGTKALKYIEWGESQDFALRPSCANRNPWYDLGTRIPAKILWPMIHSDRPGVYLNNNGVLVDHNLFEILTNSHFEVWASLFWAGQIIFRELYGRSNLGQGALKTEGHDIKELMVLGPQLFSSEHLGIIKHSITNISKRVIKSIGEEVGVKNHNVAPHPLQDRVPLDNVIFDIIELNLREREEVYRVAYELVNKRLTKSESLKKKGGSYGSMD
jgi:type I restriction-modification system DNA methylase subunit